MTSASAASETDDVARRADGAEIDRDLASTRAVLEPWLAERLGVTKVRIPRFGVPAGSGSSSETFLFDACIDGDDDHRVELVLRVKPTKFRTFYSDSFANEYRTLDLLSKQPGVPVPKMYGYDGDASLLGAPFWVMSQIKGDAPADNPPYNTAGFVLEASPAQRSRLWTSGIEAMAHLHTVDPGDLEFMLEPQRGATGLAQMLDTWREARDWALDGQSHPLLDAGWQWLVDHQPPDARTALSWGDARIGNMLFDDFNCTAILDWEMLSLAGPMCDLGYWIVLERTWPAPRLDGLGSSAETVRIWENASGLSAQSLPWYEALAAFRLSVILIAHLRSVGYPVDLSVPRPARRLDTDGDQTATYDDLAAPARFFDELERHISYG